MSGTSNVSAYVLANCWRTLNSSLCRACLENASASLSNCFPWSEGRALNTGCFMRYSDIDFLNPIPQRGSSRGKLLACIFCEFFDFNLQCGSVQSYIFTFFLSAYLYDQYFLSAGTVIVIVVAAVSAAAVFIIMVLIGVYMWKHKTIQKKRKGKKYYRKMLQMYLYGYIYLTDWASEISHCIFVKVTCRN